MHNDGTPCHASGLRPGRPVASWGRRIGNPAPYSKIPYGTLYDRLLLARKIDVGFHGGKQHWNWPWRLVDTSPAHGVCWPYQLIPC